MIFFNFFRSLNLKKKESFRSLFPSNETIENYDTKNGCFKIENNCYQIFNSKNEDDFLSNYFLEHNENFKSLQRHFSLNFHLFENYD